jgi:hypothetical protein
MTNSDKSEDFWIRHCSQSQIWKFIIFTQPKIQYISYWFFSSGYNSLLSISTIFFQNFFETSKCQF